MLSLSGAVLIIHIIASEVSLTPVLLPGAVLLRCIISRGGNLTTVYFSFRGQFYSGMLLLLGAVFLRYVIAPVDSFTWVYYYLPAILYVFMASR